MHNARVPEVSPRQAPKVRPCNTRSDVYEPDGRRRRPARDDGAYREHGLQLPPSKFTDSVDSRGGGLASSHALGPHTALLGSPADGEPSSDRSGAVGGPALHAVPFDLEPAPRASLNPASAAQRKRQLTEHTPDPNPAPGIASGAAEGTRTLDIQLGKPRWRRSFLVHRGFPGGSPRGRK